MLPTIPTSLLREDLCSLCGSYFTSSRWSPYDSLLSLTVDLSLSLARSRTCSLRRACATATPTASPTATPPGGALPSARARGLGAEAVHAQKGAFASMVSQDVRDAGCVRGAGDAEASPAMRLAALERTGSSVRRRLGPRLLHVRNKAFHVTLSRQVWALFTA